MLLSGVSVGGGGGSLRRGKALVDAAALLAHVPDGVQHLHLLLALTALKRLWLSGQLRQLPADAEAAAQDVGHALALSSQPSQLYSTL